jgi:hypothetical protein
VQTTRRHRISAFYRITRISVTPKLDAGIRARAADFFGPIARSLISAVSSRIIQRRVFATEWIFHRRRKPLLFNRRENGRDHTPTFQLNPPESDEIRFADRNFVRRPDLAKRFVASTRSFDENANLDCESTPLTFSII